MPTILLNCIPTSVVGLSLTDKFDPSYRLLPSKFNSILNWHSVRTPGVGWQTTTTYLLRARDLLASHCSWLYELVLLQHLPTLHTLEFVNVNFDSIYDDKNTLPPIPRVRIR